MFGISWHHHTAAIFFHSNLGFLSQAYMNYGEFLLQLGRSADALTIYKEAGRHTANNADLYYNMAVVYLEMKQFQEALNNFNKALSIIPHHAVSLRCFHVLLSSCYDWP